MHEGSDFMELLQLQNSLDMITKTELLDHIRARGESLSDRQLTSLVGAGLVPKVARIGTRASAYPRIVEDLVLFIVRNRNRGMSQEAIKQLLPVWRYVQRAVRDQELSVQGLEDVAREHVTLREAAYAVPMIITAAVGCSHCRAAGHLPDVKVLMKDGTKEAISSGPPVSIGFVLARVDEETGKAVVDSAYRIAIASTDEVTQPSTVILGLAPGIDPPTSSPCADGEPEEVLT